MFNWRQNYPRLLDPKHDVPLMRVTSSEPSYWRANTLDVFTGDTWLSDGSFEEAVGQGRDPSRSRRRRRPPRARRPWRTFDLGDLATNYLFTGERRSTFVSRSTCRRPYPGAGPCARRTSWDPDFSYRSGRSCRE